MITDLKRDTIDWEEERARTGNRGQYFRMKRLRIQSHQIQIFICRRLATVDRRKVRQDRWQIHHQPLPTLHHEQIRSPFLQVVTTDVMILDQALLMHLHEYRPNFPRTTVQSVHLAVSNPRWRAATMSNQDLQKCTPVTRRLEQQHRAREEVPP